MPSVIVIPTAEEQVKIANGQEPDISNIFLREFSTGEELDSYIQGVEGLPDGMEYEVIKEDGLSIVISFDGDETAIKFSSEEEKKAYIGGLNDADGFMSPQTIGEDEEGYEGLKSSLSSVVPRP